MANRSATVTLLPVPSVTAIDQSDFHARLAPVSAERIAEAEAAEVEFLALCEEVSRVVRKPAKHEQASKNRGHNRPTNPRI